MPSAGPRAPGMRVPVPSGREHAPRDQLHQRYPDPDLGRGSPAWTPVPAERRGLRGRPTFMEERQMDEQQATRLADQDGRMVEVLDTECVVGFRTADTEWLESVTHATLTTPAA